MKKVLAIAALLATGSVFAGPLMDSMDTDKSGTINADEAAAMPSLVDQFNTLDGDADGQLSPAEFAPFEASVPPTDAPQPTQ